MQTDGLIIGGGPAGLTAAIYLARYRLRTMLIDAGTSRAGLIRCTNNHAGFPTGISDKELLSRMRLQAQRFGAELHDGYVRALNKDGDGFIACIRVDSHQATSVPGLFAAGDIVLGLAQLALKQRGPHPLDRPHQP
jgi:thioredoxin reductase (NADPH)